MSRFTHLHVHTEYSILDGLAKIKELIKKAYDDGMRAMAITDHGNMFGVLDFMKQVDNFNQKLKADEEPFKGIIGCEVYVAVNGRFSKNKEDRSGRHLILLAKNMTGYRNLCKLVTLGYSEGFYYTPRVDKELLRKYSEGLIACSACLGGELPKAIMNSNRFHQKEQSLDTLDLTEAGKVVEEFISIFGEDYYLEMQRNGHEDQRLVNEAIRQLSAKYNVKYVATNDSHFVNKEDFEAHRLLVCLNTQKDFYSAEGATEDSDNGLFYTGEEYFRTTAEMTELFADFPEAIENTQEIVDKVEYIKLTTDKATLPRFDVPPEFSSEAEYLEHLVWEGAKTRYPEMTPEIKDRITFEISVLNGMGYSGYFLIVWDFINAGRKMGIRFGPGRGSAAGSALSYCLGITNIDPIKYNLLFERFLNPDRISLPDIDIDIDDSGREKVIQYVTDKYGANRVAQIVTFNTMGAKMAIRDCARVLKLPLQEADQLAKYIPDGPGISLEESIKKIPELRQASENGSQLVKDTLKYALRLSGTVRNSGVHACGVIIGKDDLIETLPLFTPKKADSMAIQYEGSIVEDAGLLKMDFLGLKTLNIISSTLQNIKLSHNKDIDIDQIPLDDQETYNLLSRGDTTAIFQLESAGMKKHLQELRPERFEDIISMVSLYRPGPMDNIPAFIARKNDPSKIKYLIPEMKVYLEETYGITVYQEQVMLLSRLLADFTRGESDVLRKAMGKKQLSTMAKLEEKFYEGGVKKGYDIGDLKEIWTEWEKFASYAFNKSHATCYAYVAYQTAWLKAHYPAEFMAANLTNNLDNMDKITQLIDDAALSGIKILGPDINESALAFTVSQNGDIRFGLAALKGVGASAVEAVIKERDENGPFPNIFEFVKRINLRNCNKKAIEAMAYSGTFDSFDNVHRAQYFHPDKNGQTFIERLINFGTKSQTGYDQAQYSIFDELPNSEELVYPEIPPCPKWHPVEQLRHEKNVAGFYISGHPLDEYKYIITNYVNTTNADLKNPDKLKTLLDRPINFIGIITDSQRLMTKSNKDFGKITFEDYKEEYQWLLFGEDYSRFKHLFEVGKQIFARATVKEKYRGKDYQGEIQYNITPIDVFYLHDAYEKLCKELVLTVNIKDISNNLAYLINEAIEKSPGKLPLSVQIISDKDNFHSTFNNFKIKIDPEQFIQNLKLTIPHKVSLK